MGNRGNHGSFTEIFPGKRDRFPREMFFGFSQAGIPLKQCGVEMFWEVTFQPRNFSVLFPCIPWFPGKNG